MSRIFSKIKTFLNKVHSFVVDVRIGCISQHSNVFALVDSFKCGRWMIRCAVKIREGIG